VLTLNFDDLIEYTDWERQKWLDWFRGRGDQVLKISAGPHGDGRFATAGDLVRHIFSAETRYVDRLSARPLTDTGSIPNDNVEALFRFGQTGREALRAFINSFPAQRWDVPEELNIGTYSLKATPRKIITHVVLHEIRHWAQLATLFRLNGLTGEFHDFLFSPAMSGGREGEQAKA